MSSPVAIEVKKEVEGDTYSYDGTVYKINGERRLGIDNVLVTLFNMNKKEMRRHALFWDVISPADLGNEELWVQIKMLKARLAKLKDGGVAEDPLPVYPRQIFENLATEWHTKHGWYITPPYTPPAANNVKTELDEPISDNLEILPNKKIKMEESASEGVSAAIPSHAAEQQAPNAVNSYWGKRTETPWTPERSEDEKNLLSQHEACRAKQTFVAAMGTYWIQCPLIENKHPELASSLRMVVRALDDHTQERGLLEAYLNLGLLKGTMVMAPGLDIVQDWCYRHQSQRKEMVAMGNARSTRRQKDFETL